YYRPQQIVARVAVAPAGTRIEFIDPVEVRNVVHHLIGRHRPATERAAEIPDRSITADTARMIEQLPDGDLACAREIGKVFRQGVIDRHLAFLREEQNA